MRWFLVRLLKGEAEAYPTRELAVQNRDWLVKNKSKAYKKDTIEVIPVSAILDMIREWDKMITNAEFELALGDGKPVLTIGEVAIIRSMKQDILERLDAQ